MGRGDITQQRCAILLWLIYILIGGKRMTTIWGKDEND